MNIQDARDRTKKLPMVYFEAGDDENDVQAQYYPGSDGAVILMENSFYTENGTVPSFSMNVLLAAVDPSGIQGNFLSPFYYSMVFSQLKTVIFGVQIK